MQSLASEKLPLSAMLTGRALVWLVCLLAVFAVGLRFWWLALGLGVAASVVIETGQELLLPERMPSTSDVIANALGTALGVAVGCLILAWRARRRALAESDADLLGQGLPSP